GCHALAGEVDAAAVQLAFHQLRVRRDVFHDQDAHPFAHCHRRADRRLALTSRCSLSSNAPDCSDNPFTGQTPATTVPKMIFWLILPPEIQKMIPMAGTIL